jgi:peptidylprolyl isomerase
VEGAGGEAVPGGVVGVHSVGVELESGEGFDSSWNGGQSAPFPPPQLTGAWPRGIRGRKVGGRRQLICPPEFAYGPAGGGHHLSGKTLIFVIDLLGVG